MLTTRRPPTTEDDSARRAYAEKLVGSVLSDRYRVDEVIASGAMASVYRGLHLKMRKQVAIKVLHPDTEDFPDLVTRFEREAVAGAHISHPNVASASDMGTFGDGSYFLVLEYVSGRTLRDVIAEEAPMDPKRVVKLGRQLASALAAAHAKGIVHRDLKPRNVMVTPAPDELVKLIDFGLAKVDVEDVAPLPGDASNPMKRSLSATGVVFGTVGYMAPETALGMKAVGEPSDLYSLGVILYELLSGDHPFKAADPRELFALHRSAKPPPLSRANISVPPALEALVMDLLEKDPGKRIQRADEVIARFDQALAPPLARPVAALVAAASVEPSSEHAVAMAASSSRTRTALVAAVLVLLAASAFAIYWFSFREKPAPAPAASESAAVFASAALPSASAPVAVSSAAVGAKSNEDAAVAARLMNELVAQPDQPDAAGLIVELAEVGPLALRDDHARAAARSIAEKTAEGNKGDADKLYYALAYKFGTDGLDLLYDLSAHSTSSKAAQRAGSILEIQGASMRATPALRIALELSKVSCQEKALLFQRAAKEGDARTLEILKKLEPPACTLASPCCFLHNADLERAINALSDRAAAGKTPG